MSYFPACLICDHSLEGINNWALHTIERPGSSYVPFASSFWWSPSKPSADVVTQTFNEVMHVQSKVLDNLIIEAETLQRRLEKLRARLNGIAEISTRESIEVSEDKEKLLGRLWFLLGGHRKDLKRYNNNLALLNGIGTFLQEGKIHVQAALITLRGMKSDMKDLRSRAAAPDVAGSLIPREVHIKSIQAGLSRLKRGKDLAGRLEEEMIQKILKGD
jgi:hypothetical protein